MDRRRFLELGLSLMFGTPRTSAGERSSADRRDRDAVTVFLCGDVMTGRGIDQVLPHPGDPRLYEPWVTDAREYVQLAEQMNGPVPRPVDFAYLEVPQQGRALVFAFGVGDSGIPPDWAATRERPGVVRLDDLSDRTVRQIAERIASARRARDVVVASVHWGGNWGYAVPYPHRRSAHALIEEAGVDLVHGHSSHHPRGIDVWRERLILCLGSGSGTCLSAWASGSCPRPILRATHPRANAVQVWRPGVQSQ